jgi:hypothetical protein
MGKVRALAVISVLSVFIFLWYQEYIQSVCVNTLLCGRYDSQADEVGVLRTQSTNVYQVNNSGRILHNNTV